MKLTLSGTLATRHSVACLAADYPHVTELDFSDCSVYGASTMHAIVSAWPDALLSGLEGHNLELHGWTMSAISSDEYKANQRGGK